MKRIIQPWATVLLIFVAPTTIGCWIITGMGL